MEPFRIAAPLKTLTDVYPKPKALLQAVQEGGEQAKIAFARLWLSEGIPYAFRDCPAVYESVRSWLSSILNVHAKKIGLTGSARLGASLSPKKLGAPFGDASDLDLFIISKDFFDLLHGEFIKWSFAFERQEIKARDKREEAFWSDNNKQGPKMIHRGFIDQKMIPNFDKYPVTQKISQSMYLLVEKLKITPLAPEPKKASLRCYSSWESFVNQVALNLDGISRQSFD